MCVCVEDGGVQKHSEKDSLKLIHDDFKQNRIEIKISKDIVIKF